MKQLQGNQEASIQYVQSSYDEQLHTIQKTRRNLNSALDTIEQKTMKEMKDTLTKLQASSKNAVDKCISLRDELQQLRDAVQDISDKSRLELSFIATRKCEDKIERYENFLKENSLQVKVSITFQPNSEIVQYLSKLSGLGRIEHSTQTLKLQDDPNKVFAVQRKSQHNVRISSDSFPCKIWAICVLQDGQVLVADVGNKKVKLLDQEYQVVSHCSVTPYPQGMCQISPSEVAVTLNDEKTGIHEVQFIKVNNRQLMTGMKLQLQHTSRGIAFHKGDLYITTDTALYKYTVSGKLVSKIYEEKSDSDTVYMCAVSPTGDTLYITNASQDKLLTLASDGSVLAIFTDAVDPGAVHVTPAGQVLLCGCSSHIILQVNSKGRRKLATLATQEDGIQSPVSICYNRHTACIIVGLLENNSILVFKADNLNLPCECVVVHL
ncbi:uncharacterized protein LOC127880597 [Dreissena polymorpha]|uniref:uncharacterized protein LOC127880597 n=1 Tax=Dreissena polymorpha TaxID=45954 RepID=UPI0022647ADC|nr:uncharacterized protein LOC127880597 [Dreissena polymorpha]